MEFIIIFDPVGLS